MFIDFSQDKSCPPSTTKTNKPAAHSTERKRFIEDLKRVRQLWVDREAERAERRRRQAGSIILERSLEESVGL